MQFKQLYLLLNKITAFLFCILFFHSSYAQLISKIADGFHNPTGVCVAGNGVVYIADYGNHIIKKIDTNGNVTTIAGTGVDGYSGDGGPATEAELNFPYRLCIDNSGNIYFSDHQNNVIRKISSAGIISTVVGNGTKGFSGDGGLAIEAQLNNPLGICVDSEGNLFIADGFNHRIRKVNTTGIITTIAGSGSTGSYKGGYSGDAGPATEAELNLPTGIAIDSQGNLYVSEENNSIIRKINAGGIISTVAGNVASGRGYSGDGGSAISARLNSPLSVGIDNSGNIYFTDESNFVIRKISAQGIISTIGGNGTQGSTTINEVAATQISLGNPNGIFVTSDGQVYFTDNTQNILYKITN